jgi:hypothetical protein
MASMGRHRELQWRKSAVLIAGAFMRIDCQARLDTVAADGRGRWRPRDSYTSSAKVSQRVLDIASRKVEYPIPPAE